MRSVSMDKWKDVELERMKVGGNRPARVFFESQPDYSKSLSLLNKYSSKAAALYRDKVRATTPALPAYSPTYHIYLFYIQQMTRFVVIG